MKPEKMVSCIDIEKAHVLSKGMNIDWYQEIWVWPQCVCVIFLEPVMMTLMRRMLSHVRKR